MSEEIAVIEWRRASPDFLKGRYSREHTWTFDGGTVIPASASPLLVPVPFSNPTNVDPEEAFVAAISSCHMLTFLFLACQQGFQVDTYRDRAVGEVIKDDQGNRWVCRVKLNPEIAYSGERLPTPAEEQQLHHHAHGECIIANSVKTAISVVSTRAPPTLGC